MRSPILPFALAGATLLATAPAPQAPVLGPRVEQTLAQGTYFHVSGSATLATLRARFTELMPRLCQAMTDGHVRPTGPLVVVYQGLDGQPGTSFALELGFLVEPGTSPAGAAQVRTLAPFHAVTMTFTGQVADLGQAYAQFYPALIQDGKIPTRESRQMILYWENPASVNNLFQIQAGIQ